MTGELALLRPNVDPDALTIGDLYQKARTSVVDSVRYLIEAGHRLIKKKRELPRGAWLPWLADNADVLGFDSRFTAAKLMNIATKCAAGGTFDEAEALRISRIAWGHNVRGTEGTGDNEWLTPRGDIAAARAVLGNIDLDPASSEAAQKVVQAGQFFSKENDGLKQRWHGRVWLNPPYAQPLIAQFAAKLVAEWNAGHLTAAIALTHNYTDSAWFRELAGAASAICFTRERVKFYKGDEIARPTQGQAFFYFGNDLRGFESVFRKIGFGVAPLWQCDAEPSDPASDESAPPVAAESDGGIPNFLRRAAR